MMVLDAHAHVFTLHSILSREAIRVITRRLEETVGVPKALAEAVGDLLDEHLNKPELLDEPRLLRRLLDKLLRAAGADAALRGALEGNPLLEAAAGALDDLPADALSDLITRLLDRLDGTRADKVIDVLQTLRQAMKPTITDVAEDLLREMEPDGVLVALMMDIFRAPESGTDRRRYLAQIDGTAEAALQFPGRVLPFFGVHPDRPGHLDELKRAVESKGFVGVKLYPSLGYAVDSAPMRRVYAYCVEKDLPVLLHCGHGGFYRDTAAKELCNPNQWTGVLRDHPALRVCFAHFGGWEALGHRHCLGENWPPPDAPHEPPSANWGKQILDFMLGNPNVYTDLAKHVEMFEDPAHARTYFDTLRALLADPRVGDRILFGTDAWLLRLDMPFEKYWRLWKAHAGTAWPSITHAGPRAFVGFPAAAGGPLRPNLQRYVDHMAAHRGSVGRPPAPWLERAARAPFTPGRDAPDWNRRSQPVRDTYQFLAPYLTPAQRDAGFAANRTRLLRDLTYFDPADPAFHARCRDLARRLVDFADQGLGPREGHTFSSGVEVLLEMLTAGRARLCDVAVALNRVVAYPEILA